MTETGRPAWSEANVPLSKLPASERRKELKIFCQAGTAPAADPESHQAGVAGEGHTYYAQVLGLAQGSLLVCSSHAARFQH